MKRAKRKALLALLRRRTFVHEQLTPELAEKLGALEWFDQWDAHVRQRFGSFESSKELTTEELRMLALKANPDDNEYLYFWPAYSGHRELHPIPSDLTVTFVQPEQVSEEVRKAARKWLEENFTGRLSAHDADGKHRGLPGRGMGVSRHLVDDLNFEVFSVPDTVLSYGSKHFSKELIDDLSAVRPQLVGLYKEQINDNGAMLSKDFFKPETHVHELGLRCMEVAGMLPRGGLAASKEDFDAFFENKPVEMLIDPAKE